MPAAAPGRAPGAEPPREPAQTPRASRAASLPAGTAVLPHRAADTPARPERIALQAHAAPDAGGSTRTFGSARPTSRPGRSRTGGATRAGARTTRPGAAASRARAGGRCGRPWSGTGWAPARRFRLSTPARDPAGPDRALRRSGRSEEHTSELQSRGHLVCRLLLEKKKEKNRI